MKQVIYLRVFMIRMLFEFAAPEGDDRGSEVCDMGGVRGMGFCTGEQGRRPHIHEVDSEWI
jgi:hypothetical protein